jgi:hypothetical protein
MSATYAKVDQAQPMPTRVSESANRRRAPFHKLRAKCWSLALNTHRVGALDPACPTPSMKLN